MRIELAALSSSMSLLPNGIFFTHIKNRQLRSARGNLSLHTVKKSAARSNFANMKDAA